MKRTAITLGVLIGVFLVAAPPISRAQADANRVTVEKATTDPSVIEAKVRKKQEEIRAKVAAAMADNEMPVVKATPIPTAKPTPVPTPVVQAAASIASGEISCAGKRTTSLANNSDVALGQQLAAERGWTGEQWTALHKLWSCESSWSVSADGPGTCWGIPQACPGSKMGNAGPNWQTNSRTQILWGLGYIADTPKYGTPVAAWRHFSSHNWY